MRNRIPDEVLKEIFPQKLKRRGAPDELYAYLKKMILFGKLKKGQGLTLEGIIQDFDVTRGVAQSASSKLKKDGLVVSKRGARSFIA